MNPIEVSGVTSDALKGVELDRGWRLCRALLVAQRRLWHPDQGGDGDVTALLNGALEATESLSSFSGLKAAYEAERRSFDEALQAGRRRFREQSAVWDAASLALARLVMRRNTSEQVAVDSLKDVTVRVAPMQNFFRAEGRERHAAMAPPNVKVNPADDVVLPELLPELSEEWLLSRTIDEDPVFRVFSSEGLRALHDLWLQTCYPPEIAALEELDEATDSEELTEAELAMLGRTHREIDTKLLRGDIPPALREAYNALDVTSLEHLQSARRLYFRLCQEERAADAQWPESPSPKRTVNVEQELKATADEIVDLLAQCFTELDVEEGGWVRFRSGRSPVRLIGTIPHSLDLNNPMNGYPILSLFVDPAGDMKGLRYSGSPASDSTLQSAVSFLQTLLSPTLSVRSGPPQRLDGTDEAGVEEEWRKQPKLLLGARSTPDGALMIETLGLMTGAWRNQCTPKGGE